MRRINIKDLQEVIFSASEIDMPTQVPEIIALVREKGDIAVQALTKKYDRIDIDHFEISSKEIKAARKRLAPDLRDNFEKIMGNIRCFAERQMKSFAEFEFEIQPGVKTGQMILPIEKVGVYVPGGRYPLVSSLFMGVIPARVAGVEKITVCSPPGKDGTLPPALLAAADMAGVDRVYRIGGAQAVAAMAYGTESIEPVDKIVGPGNRYVTAAKKILFGKVGIDFIAGPTEVLVIADETANPEFIAADILAQAEHDTCARCFLVTDSEILAAAVEHEISLQLPYLDTQKTAAVALEKNGVFVLVKNIHEAVLVANTIAPEHLQIDVKNPEAYISQLRNFGSLFIGKYAAEILGDYSSGLNHVLPTAGAARYTGGLSVKDFLKIQTTLKVEQKGFQAVGPPALCMALIEGLAGHARTAEIRLKSLV